mmetsp:Transcript_24607/g.46233  ORF Transcript_24607/g.46233 Transcript_24607/m.46233 type:complete len:473 (+) Transcript_24607:180-1598(+)
MGQCLGSGPADVGMEEEDDDDKKKEKRKDNRKRNSQLFSLVDFIDATKNRTLKPGEEEIPELDYTQIICTNASGKKARETDWTKMDPRAARANKTADAVANGNMRCMREQVIGHFTTINRPYTAHWEGDTLLHIVCREGYKIMVEFMFDPKNRSIFDTTQLVADVENAKWRTPLHLAFTPPSATFSASRWGGLRPSGIPKSEKPEDIEIASDWIQPGGEKERKEIINILVEKGQADVNKLDFHNYSPLHYAVIWGWDDIVEYLVEKGADIEQLDIVGDNCLMLACKHNHLTVVEWLVENTEISVNSRNAEGNTALFIAVENGNLDICECLLSYDADVNAVNYSKKTPLKIACASQHTELAHMLLDFKAQRRRSAIALLEGSALYEIQKRLDDDEAEAKAAAEAQRKGKAGGLALGANVSSYGQWVPYLDKKKNEIFYYNKVSRECQWEEPGDYKKNLTYVMRRATFGMHFYH